MIRTTEKVLRCVAGMVKVGIVTGIGVYSTARKH